MTNWTRAAFAGLVGLFSIAAGQAPDTATIISEPAGVPAAFQSLEAPHIDSFDDVLAGQVRATDPTTLAALVAAVRAERPVELSVEARCLATAIYFESKGEPLAGQLAVAQVILNRTESGRWADSACGVIMQPSQFSFVRGGRAPTPRETESWAVAQAVALIAMSESWRAVVGDATHFHATRVNPNWAGKRRVATIGRHIFYR
jgi:spore germination cell wall hydrolase CwlJ-like protein